MITQLEYDSQESEWRALFAGRSLVVEAGIDGATAIEAIRVLGSNWFAQSERDVRRKLLHRYRATLAAGLCAIGSRDYDEGTYWPNVASAFGRALSPQQQSEVSDGFRGALESLGLSRFEVAPRNIAEILMHSGVPVPSLDGFIRLLVKRDVRYPNETGRQFVAWMRSMSKAVAVTLGIDVPTWRFLVEGGEIAEDFVDRCLLLIDQATGDADSVDVGLPVPVLDEISRVLATAADRQGTRARRTRQEDLNPIVEFSVREGVRLRLPALETVSESAIRWQLNSSGRSTVINVPAPWPGDPIVPTWYVVEAPSKAVTATVQPVGNTWDIELVDVDDPLLIFDSETDAMVPIKNSLPAGPAWLVFANADGLPADEVLEYTGDFSTLSSNDAPYGWEGWSFISVDLGKLTRLRHRDGKWRYVSAVKRPSIVGESILEFTTTPDGRPVYTSGPRVVLPRNPQGTTPWTVSLTRAVDRRVISTQTIEVSADQVEFDPWTSVIGGDAGEYELTVRGPLGRGLTRRIAVALGYVAHSNRAFRWMESLGRGLESARVDVMVPESEVEVRVDLGGTTSSAPINLGDGQLPVVVGIPSMTVSARGTQTHEPSSSPIPLDLESLNGTFLRIALPSATTAQLVAESGGRPIQTVNPGDGWHSGARQFPLDQLSAALEKTRGARLLLVVGNGSIPIAQVRPKALATGVSIDETGLLTLDGAVPVEGLVAAIYPKFAPWLPPYEVEFASGEVATALADEIRGEGAGTVVLRVRDPWTGLKWAETSDPADPNSFFVRLGAFVDPVGRSDSGFRSWLAGEGECPRTAESLSLSLRIYTVLKRTLDSATRRQRRSEIALAVRSNRELLMDSVLSASTNIADLMRLFVESEVVTVPCEAWESSEALWSYSAALGVLADTDELATDQSAVFRSNLSRYVGSSSVQILDQGVDPYAATGRFDPAIVMMNSWPQERVDDVWRTANPLPGRLLDKDPRANGAKSLFDVRKERLVSGAISSSQKLLQIVRGALVAEMGPQAWGPIAARTSQDGWANLPALSIGFALCARLAARGGDRSSVGFYAIKDAYTALAEVAPDIVERDLALAELWITRWELSQ